MLDGQEYRSETIAAPAKAVLSAETLTCTGQNVRPTVEAVYDTEGKRIEDSNYTVSYSSNSRSPGTYIVKISLKGDHYTGSIAKTYKIAVGKVSGLKNSAQSTSSIKVSWAQQRYATGYALYASDSKYDGYRRIATIKTNRTTSYTYSRLKTGRNYYFKIRAYKTIGGKNYYSLCSSVLISTTKPGKVTGLKAGSQSTSQIKLSWKKVSGASGYQLYRYNSAKNKFEKVATVKGTSYINKKLKSGTKYQYKVRAYRKSGNLTVTGRCSSVLTSITKPGKVTGLKASSRSSSQIKLSWKKVRGASGYRIYRYSSAKKKYVRTAVLNSSKTAYTDKKLKSGKKYKYKIKAYKKTGNTTLLGSSSAVSGKTKRKSTRK